MGIDKALRNKARVNVSFDKTMLAFDMLRSIRFEMRPLMFDVRVSKKTSIEEKFDDVTEELLWKLEGGISRLKP